MTLHCFFVVLSVALLPINLVNSSKGITQNYTRHQCHKIHKEKGHLEEVLISFTRFILVRQFDKNFKVGDLIPRTEDYIYQNAQPLYKCVYSFLLLLFYSELLS